MPEQVHHGLLQEGLDLLLRGTDQPVLELMDFPLQLDFPVPD